MLVGAYLSDLDVLAELEQGGQLWSEIHMLRVTTRRLLGLWAETEELEKLAPNASSFGQIDEGGF